MHIYEISKIDRPKSIPGPSFPSPDPSPAHHRGSCPHWPTRPLPSGLRKSVEAQTVDRQRRAKLGSAGPHERGPTRRAAARWTDGCPQPQRASVPGSHLMRAAACGAAGHGHAGGSVASSLATGWLRHCRAGRWRAAAHGTPARWHSSTGHRGQGSSQPAEEY